MFIDCHGHFTTAPKEMTEWRDRQIKAFEADGSRVSPSELHISDDQIHDALENGQLKLQRERGIDVAIFSPGAGKMAHHFGDLETSIAWSNVANDMIYRAVNLFPENFIGVCQLPQSPGAPLDASVKELERCVNELGFVGCNINPDPSDGWYTGPPITDRSFYPLYEKMVELDVPGMLHVAMSCNPAFHGTCAHYLAGDTTVFMQMALSDLFKDFPTLKLIIPHGGGAVPYHWGRYRGVMLHDGKGELKDLLLNNVYFDSCVYWQKGLQLLLDAVGPDNVLFASEMIGAVKGIDPETGHNFDDTKWLLEQIPSLKGEAADKVFSGNAMKVYPRLENQMKAQGITVS